MPNELEKKIQHLKKGKRRQKRQKAAIQLKEQQSLTNNNNNNNNNNSNETIIEQDQTYLQQKAQWEERERQYNIINIARKKAIEAEKKARELAMEKWTSTLRNLPIPTPYGYSSTDSSLSVMTKQSSIQKKFTPSSSLDIFGLKERPCGRKKQARLTINICFVGKGHTLFNKREKPYC
ncbi:unnamed protein product [Cunninghamella echinulata]